MQLKCIGGLNDGESHFINDRHKPNDWVRVPAKVKPVKPYDFDEFLQKNITVGYSTYLVTSLHFGKDDRMLFLIPTDWTYKQAIQHQFSK